MSELTDFEKFVFNQNTRIRELEAEREEWKEQASAGTLDPQRITDLIRERDDLKLRVLELEEQQSDAADEARFYDR